MADLGNLHFGVHLKDYTDAEADKIKSKLENLTVKLNIDGKNVNVSNTDLIKKQIEDAIKSVAVQSVKIDTNSVKTQVSGAFQGLSPQVNVTLLKGTLSNDLQAYLNSKTFTISVDVSRNNARNSLNTAFANIAVPVSVTINSSAAIQQLRQSLTNSKIKVGIEAKDPKDLVKDIEAKLRGRKIKVDMEADKNLLVQSVKQALQGTAIKAQVDVNVDASAITRAVQSAINNANFTYNPNGGRRNSSSGGSSNNNWGRTASNGLYESARASVSLGRSLSTNIRLAGELGTALGTLSSIFGIQNLLRGIVEIGGQLENQRIALGAILQDGGKATEMFGKIQSLAVKSPFGVMDLNQYTKQLSAYGIEYNELYDTMKRMADISAGVGVDMGRIILAFGQVRAAGFLKGTELRQFTEANIPMVEKLAERFSLLEKRIVSAGEVYDMISKKKISFEDVKAVLWELTGEGGVFNNMQEVLSESLASKWKNLSDAIDVMYGKIADGYIGKWSKSIAEGLTELTKNWEYLTTAIGSSIAAFAAYKTSVAIGSGSNATGVWNMIKANKALEVSNLMVARTYRELGTLEKAKLATAGQVSIVELRQAASSGVLTKEMTLRLLAMKKITKRQAELLAGTLRLTQAEINQAAATSRLSVAWGRLSGALTRASMALKAMFLSPWTWVFAGITAISELFTYYSKKQDEIEERNKNVAESAKGSAETLERELSKLKDLDISKMNTDEMKIKVKELTSVIQNEADGWQSILSEIFAQNADGTFVNSAMEQLKLLKKKIDEIAQAKKKLFENNELYSDVNEATESGALWWENDIVDAVKKYSEAISDNDKKLKELAIHANDVYTAISQAAEGNKELQSALEGKSLVEQISLLREYKEAWRSFTTNLDMNNQEAFDIINSWEKSFTDQTVYGVWGAETVLLHKLGKAKDILVKSLQLDGEDMGNLSENARQYILGYAELLIKEAAVQKPKIQQYLYDWFTGEFVLPKNDLNYKVPSDITNVGNEGVGSKKDAVAEMWKRRANEIEKAVKMYDQWKKVEGTVNAASRVKGNKELSSLFNGAYGFNLDLENPTEAYKYIQSKLNENLEAQKELKIQLGVKISDAELKDAQDALKASLEEIKKETNKIVEGWDLYDKLFEATGNKKVSMNIAFGGSVAFGSKLEQLQHEIEEKMSKLGIGIKFEDLIKMDTKSLEEGGYGALTGIIETYNKEATKVKEESVKNFIEIINKSKDFSQQIVDIEREFQKNLEDLRKNAADYTPEELNKAEMKLREEADKRIVKVQFEEFKESSDWVKVFDDLDRVSNATLENMIKNIEEFAKQAHLSEEVTKQLVEAMAKLREEAIDRNPFEGFKDAWNRLKELRDYTKNATLVAGGNVYRTGSGTADDPYQFKSKKEVDDNVSEATDELNDAALKIADKFEAVADAIDLVSGMFENLGVDMSGFMGTLVDVLHGTVSGAKTGSELSKSLGIGGAWGAAAGAAIGAISSIAASHDKKLDAAIDKSKLKVKELGNAYERLEGIIEWQLGGATDKQATEMLDNLNNQVYELYRQRELEEKKKKTDPSKIEDYNKQIHEAEIAVRDFYANLANEQYGVDIKNWASDIASALTDAFASGEDAAQAFDNTVGGILKSLATEAIRMQFIEPAMNNLRSFLFDSKGGIFTKNSLGGTQLTELEAGRLAAELDKLKEQIGAANEYWDAINEATGGILDDTEGMNKGGLSKDIQGVTEDTANLLGSYMNAMRQDLSVNRSLLEQLIGSDVPKMSYLAEAQLRELGQITANTKRNADAADKIYDLVNRVVDKGSNKLKV